ncbi:DUF6542 domain-containing protein [Streptomyces sp. NPDC020096]
MEQQPSTRTPQPARSGVPEPTATCYRARRRASLPEPVATVLRRIVRPSSRLTGLGTGLVVVTITVIGGALDNLFTDEPGTFFGVVFVVASVLGALWVRGADLAAAPVSAPIAFALALGVTGESGDGSFLGHLAGTVTGLATRTGWLYGGTLLAAVIVAARKISDQRARRRP